MTQFQLSESEWKKRLSPAAFHVLREAGTEAPGSGELLYETNTGIYKCGACGQDLFDSNTKFDSGCGWPSFFEAKAGATETRTDTTHGMIRTEVRCSNCGSHLGHVFPDAPQTPTGNRYCMNSVALSFQQDKAS
ncbi:peptide-methionine (R)-S-oxide reductase MsrB [Mobiluncus mulieris]|uniref:peptide-methionine (R)-S-oxide reductase n=2 Tax=Mobiluncus mulieris TaxID=2052 RepID=E0QS10_9ACTO|nr:peptide-methionine (R)-S-oxide reductase MsrB [Mobiluncus mulieris]EEJ54074.1 methionine-R-sulfoxide reductase [Mobiluncus mulieris ATCC 35243]EEZ91052.1 methionine-R-sulfoxide reductase [Mobiluncus mulieris 28-1]EFM45868.1 methionine-R-sulfoxide reductase [Mobiluncus mulieris ATCC 35239]EFN93133.1 methionine-R-sulfoxide reductase [Mobiluncus mulieris FB024-16]MBB5845955.1 peptide-methionine (R)-S-oxide reductase [Mobiluncus mulieris]